MFFVRLFLLFLFLINLILKGFNLFGFLAQFLKCSINLHILSSNFIFLTINLFIQLLNQFLLFSDDISYLSNFFFFLSSHSLSLNFLLVFKISELLIQFLKSRSYLLEPIYILIKLKVVTLQLFNVVLCQVQIALNLLIIDSFLFFLFPCLFDFILTVLEFTPDVL